jgi:hypothetical protein
MEFGIPSFLLLNKKISLYKVVVGFEWWFFLVQCTKQSHVNIYEDIELWGAIESGVENYLNLRCGQF